MLIIQPADVLFISSGPHPPQNLSLSHVTFNSAMLTWSHQPGNIPDGFVINVTRGLNTRSRFLPSGKLGSYTVRELTPGQQYQVALISVHNTEQGQVHSVPQRVAFTTCERQRFVANNALHHFPLKSDELSIKLIIFIVLLLISPSASAGESGEEREAHSDRTGDPDWTHTFSSRSGRTNNNRELRRVLQVHVGAWWRFSLPLNTSISLTAEVKLLVFVFVCCRYTELVNSRGKITAKFTHLPRKTIRHRASKFKTSCNKASRENHQKVVW